MQKALAALAVLFFAAHLPFLPPALEDIDSVNFALGVRDFDVARHQPHPPGYPVYIALSKVSTALFGGAGNPNAVVSGLSVWSALAGAALVVLLFVLFRALDGHERRAWWAMGITVASPLFWFTALRPLSDMTGLAAAIGAQAVLLSVIRGRQDRDLGRFLAVGAFATGIAAGIRVQTVVLTAPLLVTALTLPRAGLTLRTRVQAALAGIAGVLFWAVPLILVSGGLGGYLAALGTQAGEDFSGVVMLWTTPKPRAAADAIVYTFLWPWGSVILGGIVLTAAVIGTLRVLLFDPRMVLLLAVAFGPYAVFHMLFHETLTVRYALPLVAPVAFLACCAFDWLGRRPATILSAMVIAVSLTMGARAAQAYDSSAAPAFQAMQAISAAGAEPVGMHAVFRRASEWMLPVPSTRSGQAPRILRAPHGREWLALIDHWRTEPQSSIAFVADPRRTDLALFDPHARELKGSYRWTVPVLPYVGGVRPVSAEWYLMRPPGWMLDRGWALSAEIGGVSARDVAGPHLQPSVAWVRARPGPALLMIGGRDLHASVASTVTLSRGDVVIDRWEIRPGFFFRLVPLGAGALAGEGYLPLSLRAASAESQAPVSLEQFDLQPDGVVMAGFLEGWQEPEYNPTTARSWRWMSERAVLWVRPIGRDVTLTLAGESPLRYFEAAPAVRVTIGGQEAARFSPTADFTQRVRLSASALEAAGGRVIVESDRWFVPAERGESLDPRHLALRIYAVSVAIPDPRIPDPRSPIPDPRSPIPDP